MKNLIKLLLVVGIVLTGLVSVKIIIELCDSKAKKYVEVD